MIAVIDYGAGNLHSVKNALAFLGAESQITDDPAVIRAADRVILPGVGAFGDAMSRIRAAGLDTQIKEAAASGKPFLGICLGLQLLFEESEESPGVRGLGIFRGKFSRIPQKPGLKIPHMGWNSLRFTKESPLFAGIGEEPFVYFVHSYYLSEAEEGVVSAVTEYGSPLSVAAERGNVFATQFHPEKSGRTGLLILKNFLEI